MSAAELIALTADGDGEVVFEKAIALLKQRLETGEPLTGRDMFAAQLEFMMRVMVGMKAEQLAMADALRTHGDVLGTMLSGTQHHTPPVNAGQELELFRQYLTLELLAVQYDQREATRAAETAEGDE